MNKPFSPTPVFAAVPFARLGILSIVLGIAT